MIVYFSGTGNSKHTAERIAEAMNDRAVSIEGLSPEIMLQENEVFGIVTPTTCYELPYLVREFIRKLTLNRAAYTFVIATWGSSPGCTGKDAAKELAKRGIALSAAFSIRMPDIYTPIFDLSDPAKVAESNALAEKAIDETIVRIQARETGNHMEHRLPLFLKAVLDPMLENTRKTKNFHVEDSCISCGLCARRCPVSAIEIRDGKPVWVKDKCAACFRCMHHCPKFAIQYGKNTKKHGQYRNPYTKV